LLDVPVVNVIDGFLIDKSLLSWNLVIVDVDIVNFSIVASWISVLLIKLLLLLSSGSSKWNLMLELVLVI
jgi:hypothetical protein